MAVNKFGQYTGMYSEEQFELQDEIEFRYHDKLRVGTVVQVEHWGIRVEGDGWVKSFNYHKMSQLVNHTALKEEE
jgi:hypothetical protein